MNVWGMVLQAQGKVILCKGPEAGTHVLCWKNKRKEGWYNGQNAILPSLTPPHIHMLNLNFQGSGIRGWGFGEVIGS